ncbi:MAG TPA: serine hydrolase [Gemmataceae bacterium]|nr:serine hydrolase [Gemmataceae bacterium]
MYRILGVLAVLLVLPAPSSSQPRIEPPPKYTAAVATLEKWLAREVEAKHLPALSIALVEDQTIVWARGFGFQDAAKMRPATAETVYRVGSVSKPITALVLMMLVEMGLIDLDAPVTRYLPDFRPHNPFGKDITLRQILAHRSGLVREPPVGSYFDADNPPLAKLVASLNQTTLVFPPEKRTSYSNAALATAGFVLEKVRKEPFAHLLQKSLLDPLGMKGSSYQLTPELKKRLADAVMWTYHGREFPAPTFELSMAPAGNLYSNVLDLARLQSFLFAGGRTADGKQLLKRATLEQMWKPQFVKPGVKAGFGVGFHVSEFEGRRRVEHAGAVYGFATEFATLPEDKLGVVVVASKESANGVTRRVAEIALRHLLAVRQGKPLPVIEETRPVDPEQARRLAGRYQTKGKSVELRASAGRLYLWPLHGGFRVELRALGKDLMGDDLTSFGPKVSPTDDGLRIGKETYRRVESPRPAPPPAKWRGLIGEYGWDHNTLYVLEMDGRLYALIEWFFLYPLTEETVANVVLPLPDAYHFPDLGLYPGEKLVFTRGGAGQATKVVAASVLFERRRLDGEDGKTFTIKPIRQLDAIRREALAAKPPVEKKQFRAPDLVDVTTLDPTVKLDIRYATTNNFLSTPFYTSAKAYLQRPAAEALVRAHKKLAAAGYGLLIHDAYRPWHVTKMFWEATPPKYRHFVADPSQGSRHNRGCAVDLTLYDLKTGKAVEMVGGFDEFSDRSYPDYPGGTALQRWQRDLLRRTMEAEGFTVYEAEWWHFDYRDWRTYPILNLTFEQLERK